MVKGSEVQLDRLFHALSNVTRRAILQRLTQGDLSVGELAQPFDMSIAAVSKHVDVLADANLVSRARQGRTTRCHLNVASLAEAAAVLDFYRDFWQGSLTNLNRFLTESAGDGE
jgi:DNA-binding transcriptional ArsR family regulator